MKKLQILSILLIVTMLSACGKHVENKEPVSEEPVSAMETTEPEMPTEQETPVSEKPEQTPHKEDIKPEKNSLLYSSDIEKTAILVDRTYEDTKDNTMVSPLSLNFALGMITEGANGKTKEILNAYLNSENYGDYVSNYLEYTKQLNNSYETFDGGYKNVFEIANSVWINDESKINSDYQKRVSDIYQSEINSFNADKVEEAAARMNGWVSEKTHQMIPQIINPMMIDKNTQSILINTVYFESAWWDPWDYYEDYKKDFTNIDGDVSQITYMTGNANSYYENDKATAFSYRYMNGLSFIGILPKEEGDFNFSDLNIEELLKTESYNYTSINVEMPRLNFDTNVSIIKDMMMELGMESIFDENLAEFDEIINEDVLYIDDIIQKCKIELDENGTKAAAATAIFAKDNAIMIEEANIKEVFLNRSFAFLIYDSENEQIVFAGKVVKI